jgi:hypothetical protein
LIDAGQFPLQESAQFGTFADVRMVVVMGTLFIGITTAVAQEQERKLVDRLLKPNTALTNPAQNKKFSGERVAALDRPARTRTFYSPEKTVARTFPAQSAFTPQQFAARHFRAGDSAAYISPRAQLKNNDVVIPTPAASAGSRVAPESSATVPAPEYAGSRPFLGRGKSQKALSAQDKPLTIEQVRELLNKSK